MINYVTQLIGHLEVTLLSPVAHLRNMWNNILDTQNTQDTQVLLQFRPAPRKTHHWRQVIEKAVREK